MPARPNATIEQITQVAGQDVAVSAKLLQLVNSAFFGLARDVSDVNTAVSCLGLSVLHDLVVTVEAFRPFTPNDYASSEYMEEFHRHAQLSARIAAGIVKEGHQQDTVLVVYAADLLAHEACPQELGFPTEEFDLEYLNECGALELLPRWREIAGDAHAADTRFVS